MDYKVLLLTILFAVVEGQSTTVTPPSTLTSKADQGTTRAAFDSSETASTDEDDLKAAGSERFTFTQEDALLPKKMTSPPKPDNNLETSGDDENPFEELTMFEKLLSDNDKTLDDAGNADAKPKDSKSAPSNDDNDNDDNDNDNDDDDDDDDEGDDDSSEDGENNPKPSSDTNDRVLLAKPDQLRRQGDLRPGYGQDKSNVDSRQNQDDKPDTSAPAFLPIREQAPSPDTSSDGSPLNLQLTQGGYKSPYQRFLRFEDPRQRMRSGSASQQSETLEAPRLSGVNGNQAGSFVPQVEYSAPYQPQLNLGARPAFQHSPGGFGANGMLPGLQNGFFNTPPAGFTDFSSANFQSQFHPTDNGGFATVPRDQGGFSLFQTSPRQNLLFQATPQYPQSQPIIDNQHRPQTLFHPGGFSNYPNMDIVDDTPRPNYSPYVRHPAMNSQFQVNPNFYGTLPNSGVRDYGNPGINMMTNYPGHADRQQFQPQLFRYPTPNNQITLQSSDQVEKQKLDSTDRVVELKDSDSMKASQDKEDPTSVPFGARIRQNNAPDQNAFLGQDVYLRYPVREAGYATEENLPVQNTTEKTTRNTDPSSNPPYPFFTPNEFAPFGNSDPFSALQALQRSYTNNNRNDDSNQTREIPVDQYSRNAPVQFDDRLVQPPNPFFRPYQGNQEVPVFQNRPFLPSPGLDNARSPFYQMTGLPENNYQFAAPGPIRNVEDLNKTPTCAQDNNASVCFEDTDYPKRELQYALNSNTFLMERLWSPNQIVEDVTLEDQKTSDGKENDDNYICKSNIKFGLPLRAKNVKGTWKVVVNMEEDSGSSQFKQPVRLEICRTADQPCSFTQVKTMCVQKYNLQRLLSWDTEKGIHTDVYKLPVACSCQIVDAQA